MTSIITRLYGSRSQADGAAEALRQQWFSDDVIFVTGAEGPDADTEGAIRRAGVSRDAARAYAARIKDGGAVVTVRPSFGQAVMAIRILKRFHPIETGIADEFESVVDRAAPFSSFLGMRVLSRNPAPLASALALTTLSRKSTPKAALMRNPAPVSSSVGMSLLRRGAAPLSTKLGLRLLSAAPTPLSARAGLAVLSRSPTPLSSRLGLRLLSRNPTPLSSLLGLGVLSRR